VSCNRRVFVLSIAALASSGCSNKREIKAGGEDEFRASLEPALKDVADIEIAAADSVWVPAANEVTGTKKE
jgi:hypothetical protein